MSQELRADIAVAGGGAAGCVLAARSRASCGPGHWTRWPRHRSIPHFTDPDGHDRQVALDGVDLAHKLAETAPVSELAAPTRGRQPAGRRSPRWRRGTGVRSAPAR